jgi:hypothetical protein
MKRLATAVLIVGAMLAGTASAACAATYTVQLNSLLGSYGVASTCVGTGPGCTDYTSSSAPAPVSGPIKALQFTIAGHVSAFPEYLDFAERDFGGGSFSLQLGLDPFGGTGVELWNYSAESASRLYAAHIEEYIRKYDFPNSFGAGGEFLFSLIWNFEDGYERELNIDTLVTRIAFLAGRFPSGGSIADPGEITISTAYLRLSTDTFLSPPSLSPVPLPAALPLLMSALGFFGFFGWRRKRIAAA